MSLQFTLDDHFAVSPSLVFRALADPDAYCQWMPNFVGVERLTPGAFGLGSAFRETRRMYGKEATEHFEVTAWEPERLLELYVDGKKGSTGKGQYRFRYELTPEGTGTRLRLHADIGGMGPLLSLLGRLMVGVFKKSIVKDHIALRTYLEKAAAT